MKLTSLSFLDGFLLGPQMPKFPAGMRYLDWEKTERIRRERPDSVVYAGLAEDWLNTSGLIFDWGIYFDGGLLFNRSLWATPVLLVDGVVIECWTTEGYSWSGVPDWWGRGRILAQAPIVG